MKIGGVTVTKPVEEFLVLPRDPQPLVFRARAIENWDEFDQLVPLPKPPGKLTKDGFVPEPNDPGYRSVLANYQNKRNAYLMIRALEPSQIEWDTVDINNPKTWENWDADLKNAGLTLPERNRVVQLVVDANSLSEEKLKAARESFLRGQAQPSPESTGQLTEPVSTPSGEPAPASA